jgi:hypothetical protein
MSKFDRLLVSLRILQLEIELAALKDSLKKSTSGDRPHNLETLTKRVDGEVADRSLTVSVLSGDSVHFLIKSYPRRKLKIRIDSNKNHDRPHLHIDIDGYRHSASIAIDDGEELAGDVDRKIRKIVKKWIEDNRDVLLEIWNEVQMGRTPNGLLARVGDVDV